MVDLGSWAGLRLLASPCPSPLTSVARSFLSAPPGCSQAGTSLWYGSLPGGPVFPIFQARTEQLMLQP